MTVKSTITNPITNNTQVFYSIVNTVEEAVARHIRRIEETTPIGKLPNKYLIAVEVV